MLKTFSLLNVLVFFPLFFAYGQSSHTQDPDPLILINSSHSLGYNTFWNVEILRNIEFDTVRSPELTPDGVAGISIQGFYLLNNGDGQKRSKIYLIDFLAMWPRTQIWHKDNIVAMVVRSVGLGGSFGTGITDVSYGSTPPYHMSVFANFSYAFAVKGSLISSYVRPIHSHVQSGNDKTGIVLGQERDENFFILMFGLSVWR